MRPDNHMPQSFKNNQSILIVDDDKAFRVATCALLDEEGYLVRAVPSVDEALSLLQKEQFDLVLSDLVMRGTDGLTFLGEIKKMYPDIITLMITGYASIDTAVRAMKLGAYDYLTKPCKNDELKIKIHRALDYLRNRRTLSTLREELNKVYSFGNIVSQNERMREVFKLVKQVADTDVTVLIQGETGTGKELIARAIHHNSKRCDEPFIAVNCSAIPEQLFESELFGYERGAFTGAYKTRKGRSEDADRGSLFLDEIGYMPLPAQTKLLRFLQEKTFERVGGNSQISVDVRILAATNQPIDRMVTDRSFRNDLYYRLNIFPIHLPPLRERPDDIPLLAEHFIQKYGSLSGRRVTKIAPSVIASMLNYPWRGNIRELENFIKRAIITTEGDTIRSFTLADVGTEAMITNAPGFEQAIESNIPFKEYMKQVSRHAEIQYLTLALKLHSGNINQVAKAMELDRKTIYRKLEEYGINIDDFRT
jgi:DNA-binding NtrC family response regulator